MIIELLDGTRYDIENYSLKRLYHRIPSPTVEHLTTTVEGRDGDIFLNSRFSTRIISVEMYYNARDIYDYYLLRDELNGLFARKESFFIIFKREPYKRWKVRLDGLFETEPSKSMRPFTVNFVCENIYAESVATTLDLKEWDVDKWGWNSTIDWDEDLNYTYKTNSFVIKNLGNVPIDPRENGLEIVIQGDFPNGLTINNITTSNVYQYFSSLTTNDELKISGIKTLKNGASDFRNTNKKLLTLAVGNNSITVEGGTLTSIAFNFRFLYK